MNITIIKLLFIPWCIAAIYYAQSRENIKSKTVKFMVGAVAWLLPLVLFAIIVWQE